MTMILVVEDDADLLRSTSRLLERAGYTVGQAATGEEALQAIYDHRPDLVLLDRDLAGIDGLEVCRRIKQDPALQDTFVIIISGVYVESEEQAEGLEGGADGYLSRPLANRELLARIKAYARIHQLTASLREDVAQRKSLWEFAVEGTGLGVVDWNVSSGEVSFSDRWLSLLGYSRDQLSPRLESLTALIHPEDLPVALSGGKAIEHRLRHKLGHWLWIQSRSLVFSRSEGGEPLRVIFTHLDVSERKRAEEERLQAHKEASLGAMAGGIAHHFNNLLTTIQGNLELALEQAGPMIDEMLVDALDATRQATVVSGSMLGYLGQGVRHPEPHDLELKLTEMLPVLRAAVPANVRLELDLADDCCFTTIDLAEFRQVVFSLVTNGWEAMADQGGVVHLGARRIDGDEPQTCLEVRDNGPGMDGETRDRMFDPFFTTKFTGRGMGLSVTLGMVRAYGGSIEVDSAMGRGTTVRVYWPQSRLAELVALRPAAGAAPRLGQVLVVDDDALVLGTYRRILAVLGHQMMSACSGLEAINVFAEHADSIGCVLLDLSMPGMDGWQVLSALRRLGPNVYVVVVSGFDVAQLRSERREVEPDEWLQKPFDMKALSALLSRAETWR